MNDKEKGILREEFPDYRTDFMKLIQILFRRKFLIIIGTLVVTVVAVIFSLIHPNAYKSEAYFQLSGSDLMAFPDSRTDLITIPGSRNDLITIPGSRNDLITIPGSRTDLMTSPGSQTDSITIPGSRTDLITVTEYKRISSLIRHPEKFYSYLREKKIFSSEEIARLKAELGTPQDIDDWISPVFSLSNEDIQKLSRGNEEEKSFVMGVHLEYTNSDPEKALVVVRSLGQFVRECILSIQLKDYIYNLYNLAATNSSYYENMVIGRKFQLEELNKKRKEIQSIYAKYPESSKIETRQVVSIEQEGYRYLAPIAQLVGIESSIADLKEQIAGFEREKEKAEIYFEYFSVMKEFVDQNDSGEAIFNRLSTLKDERFKTMDLSSDTVKEVYNQLTIDSNNFKNKFFEIMRFIVDPSWYQVSFPMKTAVIIAFFVGLFISVFLALVVDFWKKNKSLILKK